MRRRSGYTPTVGATATIPSRFETTLHTGPSERDGFASRTARFVSIIDDKPSPLTYNPKKVQGLVNDSSSVSQLGYGGIASKADRFAHSFLGPSSRAYSLAPGPGYYSASKPAVRQGVYQEAVPGVGFGAASPSIGSTAHHVHVPKVLEAVPGPGSYDPLRARGGPVRFRRVAPHGHGRVSTDGAAAAGGASGAGLFGVGGAGGIGAGQGAVRARGATVEVTRGTAHGPEHGALVRADGFLSSATRFTSKPDDSPAPGQYDVSSGAAAAAVSKVPQPPSLASVFRSRTARGAFMRAGVARDTPGPGAYQVVSPAVVHDVAASGGAGAGGAALPAGQPTFNHLPLTSDPTLPSSMFALRTTDRFGKQLQPRVYRTEVPGPGSYSPAVDAAGSPAPGAALGATAAAPRSLARPARAGVGQGDSATPGSAAPASTRFELPRSDAPGPGWYKADKLTVTTGRSFHLNTASPPVWV